MASQTFEQYRSDRAYRLALVLTGTPNTEGNYSDVAYQLTLYALNSDCAYHYNYGNKLSLALNGQTLIDTANIGRVWHDGISSQQLASGTIRVPHNSDGTKSMAVSVVFQQTQALDRANYSITATMTLDTIARSSVPTVSASGAEFGSAVTIYTNRASADFTHTIQYKFGSKSGTIAAGVGASVSWTIPNDLMSEIPNAVSGTIQILCETYSGSTLIGTQQADLTAAVPAGIVPTLTVAVEEAAAIPTGITGYIQGRSRLKVTGTGSGQYGASIKSYAVTVEGTRYNGSPVTTNTISGSGTVAVAVTVTDSRGRTTAETVNVTVVTYSAPKLTGVTAYRCASSTSTTADADGAYICVLPKGSVTSLSNTNGKTCTIYYKQASAATYSSKALTMGDYVLDTEYVIFAADVGCSYDVYAVLSDSFGGSRADAPQVMAASAYMHIPKERNGMGLGKRLEGDGLDVGWEAKFRQLLTAYANVYLQKGFNVYSSTASAGSQGYICMARIVITGGYANVPINFTIARRSDLTPTLLSIMFASNSTTDPALSSFKSFGSSASAILVKAATSTWDLYIQKSEAYDSISILDVGTNWYYMDTCITITYPGTFVSTAPSGTGATQVVRVTTGSVGFLAGVAAINNSGSIDANGAVYAGNANASRAVVQSYDDRARLLMQVKSGDAWTSPTSGAYVDLKADEVQVNKKFYAGGAIESASTVKGAALESDGAVTVHAGMENYHATPYLDFHFANSTADYTARIIEGSKGVLTAIGSIVNGSDKRLKKAIRDIPDVYIELVGRLYPKLYRFTKADTYLHAGYIAQDILKTERELGITKSVLVRGTGKRIPDPKDSEKTIIDYYSVDYQAYAVLQGAYFMRRVKEQQEEIDSLHRRLERLETILGCAGATGEE